MYVGAAMTVGDTGKLGGARVATPLASVTADPSTIGTPGLLAVKSTVLPAIGLPDTDSLSVALMAGMTN